MLLEYIQSLEEHPEIEFEERKRTFKFDFELAQYISYQKRINGFVVNKPGHARKTFSSKNLTIEQKYAQALAHLNTLV